MRWTHWLRHRSDSDFRAEVDSHIAMEVERLVRGGMSPDEARYAARRAFGNPTARREEFREHRPWNWLDVLGQDVRYGVRRMRHSPGFTAIAVASLAIGIGANTTMFGAIDSLLVRAPAHIRDVDRVHRLYFQMPSLDGTVQPASATQGYKTYFALREHVSAFEAIGAFWTTKVSSGRGREARAIDAVLATPSVFRVLGVRPALGRFFAETEERDDGEHVAVIGYDAWRGQYGGDSAVLGRTIDVAGVPHVIVGVAPNGFTGVNFDRVDLWLPLGVARRMLNPGVLEPTSGSYWLEILAKRRDGVPVARVADQVTRVYRELWRDSPRFSTTFAKADAMLGPVSEGRGPAPDANARISVWVAAVTLLVLLIASANVANLLLLRGLTQSREIALRLSLGASRERLVRQALVEGALLALLGAVCALLVAHWSASAVQTFLLPNAASRGVLDPRLLAFTAAIALGTGVLASLVPAFVSARADFGPLLGSARAAGSVNRLALQRVLIGGQVAIATLLLVGAGLFVTSLRNVRAIDLGVNAERVLYVDLNSAARSKGTSGDSPSRNAEFLAMLERVRRLPGVTHASLTAGEPLATGWGVSLRRRGAPPPAPGAPMPFGRAVGTDYFETMGTALQRGRFFTAADHAPGARVAIVDEAAAKQFWNEGDALDPCVMLGSAQECTQIVGVVASTVLWKITGERTPLVYVPLASRSDQAVRMMEVRTAGDPRPMIAGVRQAILAESPDLPWVNIRPMTELLDPQLRSWRLGASMFSAFGVLALCLAAVGLYGLLSYVVAQRTHEIGVRKALGAPNGGVLRMVVRGALAMTSVGAVIGIGIALGAGKLVASQLYGVSPRDPAIFAVCVAVLGVVAIAACLGPARRATRVDPMVALRAE